MDALRTPINPDVMTNEARLHLMGWYSRPGFTTECKKARALNKQWTMHATSVYIQALYRVRGEEEVRELLKNGLRSLVTLCCRLSQCIKYETELQGSRSAGHGKAIEVDQRRSGNHICFATLLVVNASTNSALMVHRQQRSDSPAEESGSCFIPRSCVI